MKIVCIDDEELVLRLTVSLCREMSFQPEVHGFSSANAALEFLTQNEADIAITDINMPDMNGLILAAKIKELNPNIAIIFLTGYSQYAVDAFRIHASGYLLKPVNRDRLEEEVRYAVSRRSSITESTKKHIEVRTFGDFDVFVNGEIVSFARSKSKELLAYLVDRQGGSVSRSAAFTVLYEDLPYDRKMQKQFDVMIRALRQTLIRYGIDDIFELKNGVMRVIPEKVDCDLYRFYEGDIDTINSYRGEYMSSYSWASFTEAFMDRIKD